MGLAIACALSRTSPSSPAHPLLLTDLPILIPLQNLNMELNKLSKEYIVSKSLPWGSPLPASLPTAYRTSDIVLAADCVYFEPAFPLLLETLRELIGEQTLCYFCMKKRRKADMRFIAKLRKTFLVKNIELPSNVGEKSVLL